MKNINFYLQIFKKRLMFWSRSGLTFCWAWSRTKLFAKIISRWQFSTWTFQEMFDDDDDDVVDLPSNARNSQRTVLVSPPRPKTEQEDVLFVDVEGTPSENESPMAGTKRKAESPPSGHQVVSVSVPTVRSTMLEEDSNPVKLKIKVVFTACLLPYILHG